MAELAGPCTALVAALREEVAPLLARCHTRGRIATRSGRFFRGTLHGLPVAVGWTGDGAVRAARGVTALAARLPIDRLIGLGICGGLAPELVVGQLLVARQVRDEADMVPQPDAALAALALAVPGTVPGMLCSSPRILAAAADKSNLWHALGTPPSAGVDLESAAWARSAAESGLSYAVIRAVSDTAAESLPLDFSRFQAADGSVRRMAVVRHALLHPARLPTLWGLRMRLQHCAEQLAACVQAMFTAPSRP